MAEFKALSGLNREVVVLGAPEERPVLYVSRMIHIVLLKESDGYAELSKQSVLVNFFRLFEQVLDVDELLGQTVGIFDRFGLLL